jgi:hypothetical protein
MERMRTEEATARIGATMDFQPRGTGEPPVKHVACTHCRQSKVPVDPSDKQFPGADIVYSCGATPRKILVRDVNDWA